MHSMLRTFGIIPENLCRSYTKQILDGLAYLHEVGVVHCDLKVEYPKCLVRGLFFCTNLITFSVQTCLQPKTAWSNYRTLESQSNLRFLTKKHQRPVCVSSYYYIFDTILISKTSWNTKLDGARGHLAYRRFNYIGYMVFYIFEVTDCQQTTLFTALTYRSLACTIVEMLTGHPPYWELNSMSALYKIVEDDSPPPFPDNISSVSPRH
jgi:serine/threonine protein kinase